jgi:hypothetical protein
MWLLVWVTFQMNSGVPEEVIVDVFTTRYECEDARWTVEKSKSMVPMREALACIEIKKDE